MVPNRRGLIVHLSHWAAQKHQSNVAYGVAKAATDKMAAHMAHDLRPHGITSVSLYPGLVRTESVMQFAAYLDLSNSESPEFTGRVSRRASCGPGCRALHRTMARRRSARRRRIASRTSTESSRGR